MTGFVTTCEGEIYQLPTLFAWRFSYTGAEPCDSFSVRCPYEQAMADVLRRAVTVAEELGMEMDFTSPGWLKEETLRSMGLTLVPSCGACLSNMAIAPDGGVIPCQSWLSSQPLGNMLTDDWDKIWQSQRCAAIRAKSAKMEQLCQLRQGNGEEASVC